MVRDKIFEGYGWPDDHHVAAGRRAFHPVDAKRSAGGVVDEPRQKGVGRTARVATRGDRDDCQPCNLALSNGLPLLTVAEYSGQERQPACIAVDSTSTAAARRR